MGAVMTEQSEKLLTEMQKSAEADAKKAKYKIEVAYSWDRTDRNPSPAVIRIWRSGKKLHGGGDESMGWCGYPACGKPIEPEHITGGVAFCHSCNSPLYETMEDKKVAAGMPGVTEEIRNRPVLVTVKAAKLVPSKMSDLLEKMWRDLKCDADICVKFFKKKIRYISPDDPNSFDQLVAARGSREYVVYTSARLLQDTLGGTPARNLIQAFLRA